MNIYDRFLRKKIKFKFFCPMQDWQKCSHCGVKFMNWLRDKLDGEALDYFICRPCEILVKDPEVRKSLSKSKIPKVEEPNDLAPSSPNRKFHFISQFDST